MSLYIDSADRPAVEGLLATGLFAGVTTNPTILARSGLTAADIPDVYAWLTAAGAGRVYAQVLAEEPDAIYAEATDLRELGDDLIVKIPATRAGLTATRRLADAGVPVLLTAVYHASQAVLAAAAGAHSIAPYVGRMTDAGRDGVADTIQMQQILAGTPTTVLAASVREPDDVAALAAGGVADLTLGTALLERMFADAGTLQAVRDFASAADLSE